jgi:hypothetical protein
MHFVSAICLLPQKLLTQQKWKYIELETSIKLKAMVQDPYLMYAIFLSRDTH